MSEYYLGIELGSTRIKVALTDGEFSVVASGSHSWENRLENGLWTYSLDDVWRGIRAAYAQLAAEFEMRYGTPLTEVAGMCVSAMMHGYLAFDSGGELLTPFRTWRNTNTGAAAEALSRELNVNMPLRWSAAHLYQAYLDGEPHVPDVAFITTLAGYVHWKLTGERVIGVGDASGMFPLDGTGFDAQKAEKYDTLCGGEIRLLELLPKILLAGDRAGELIAEGAALLDISGALKAGIPFAPPEGDAGTGMVATNSVAPRTGNVSAGTSVFAMVVLEKPLRNVYPEIDIVATPDGSPVAMAHCNNCTSDIDAWAEVFAGFASAAGLSVSTDALYAAIYGAANSGSPDCGGLLAYNYVSGEPVTRMEEGRPLFVRLPDADFTFANFARTLLYSAVSSLKIGMDILTERERVGLDSLTGHGGFFKTGDAGRRVMSSVLGVPVSVYGSAGEGGAWGAALLAAFSVTRKSGESLNAFLSSRVFAHTEAVTAQPEPGGGFAAYMTRYTEGLEIERAAIRRLK